MTSLDTQIEPGCLVKDKPGFDWQYGLVIRTGVLKSGALVWHVLCDRGTCVWIQRFNSRANCEITQYNK